MTAEHPEEPKVVKEHDTLKYSLLGPSLTKSGQDNVDQQKVCLSAPRYLPLLTLCQVSEIIYNASKGSKYFNNEETRDKNLTEKISRILSKKSPVTHIKRVLRRSKQHTVFQQFLEHSIGRWRHASAWALERRLSRLCKLILAYLCKL
jgi:DNA polymerase kappa